MVSPDKQIYHCFGCHEGGDVFRFFMKSEGLNFPEAVEKLAERAGVRIESSLSRPGLSKDEKEELFQANRVAAWHYHETLLKDPGAQKARSYLQERGVGGPEIEKFRLGFSLPQNSGLLETFQRRKVSLEAAQKVGLLRQGERGLYESFRGRLIFPIFNRENKVVGLGGRIIEAQAEAAKYINSSDSPIYDKSAQLFGLSLAREPIRKNHRAIVVEGYMDVIALHQFGFEEAVAPLGTALTPRQINLLKRYADEIIVLFDADEAGWKAAERSLEPFLEQELSPKVLLLPAGEDPDTFLRKYGAKVFDEKLKEVRNLFSVIIDKTLEKNTKDIPGRALSLSHLRPYLLKVSRPLERNLYIRRVAEGLDVPESWVFEELGISTTVAAPQKPQENKGLSRGAEETLLELFIKFESLRPELLDKIEPDEFFIKEMRELASFLWSQVGKSPLPLAEILAPLTDRNLQNLMTKLALKESPVDHTTAISVAFDCIQRIKRNGLKQKLGDLSLQIKEAELSHQADRLANLLREKQTLLAEMGQGK